MLKSRLIFALSRQLCPCSRGDSLVQATRAYGVDHERRRYAWREKEADLERSKPGDDPDKPKTFFWFPTAASKISDFSIGNVQRWWTHQTVLATKLSQEFILERHEALGADLATAHFIIHRGGRVRFRGNDHWTERDEKGACDLPNTYSPHYILEAVDVNGIDLYYEGLSNLCGLTKLKWLSLKGCGNIDDWGLDKISAEFPQLEYLDISDCKKITERGLEALYRMLNLKTLIATNHYKSVAFELTCFMLEDCIPGLTCKICVPEEELKK